MYQDLRHTFQQYFYLNFGIAKLKFQMRNI